MKRYCVLFFLFNFVLYTAFSQRYEQTLRDGWMFARGEYPLAERMDYDDSSWIKVSIPHDYAISGPFDERNDLQDVMNVQNKETKVYRKTGRTGGLPYDGESWYRRSFSIRGKGKTFLYFDGAMSEAMVYVNGKEVAFQPNGYAAFFVDVTPFVNKREKNVLAVKLSPKAHSSRWYPGAGLFREVKLVETASTYISWWDSKITSRVIDSKAAAVSLDVDIQGEKQDGLLLRVDLVDQNGRSVKCLEQKLSKNDQILKTGEKKTKLALKIDNPQLWSPETPNLYSLHLALFKGKKILDQVEAQVGIRNIEFVKDKGFYLNGQHRQIQGVCIHHDLGAIGAAVNESVLRYRLKMLKDMGCDAIRTSHNLPSSLLPKLCDEMGLMLMIEPFDEWDTPKCENGFHRFFSSQAERQVKDMVRHFRNHASVILWGIGNEVPNQRDADGWKWVNRLQKYCHEEDSTRMVTVCMDQIPYVLANGFAKDVDIPGINYNTWNYPKAAATWTQGLILGSETASTVSSRGVYKFPLKLKSMAMYDDHQSSSYDVEYCSWSNTPDVDFALAEKNPWYLGQFVWTGFDYLGEPTPYNNDCWPSHSSLFGIIDLANLPKDRYYLYRSQWNKREHTLHLLPHWTWHGREGQVTPVMVYTDFQEAELFLNGKSLGRKRKLSLQEAEALVDDSLALQRHYRLIWDDVKYEPGVLVVKTFDEEGRVALEDSVSTAGEPFRLVATVDKKVLSDRTDEMAFVRIEVVDKYGHLCPESDCLVSFAVEGDGQFVASANGDPTDLHPFHLPQMPVFKGKLMALVKGCGRKGNMWVEAKAAGLESCKLNIKIK